MVGFGSKDKTTVSSAIVTFVFGENGRPKVYSR
jgi:hypothetical protein